MGEKLPWFPFFARDWLADLPVRLLTPAQRGIYADLLAFQWREGALPDDGAGLAVMLGADGADMRVVLDRFFPLAGGVRRNARLERERAAQAQKQAAAAAAGAKGAKKRWGGNDSANGLAMATPLPGQSHAEAEAEAEPEPEPSCNAGTSSNGSAAALALPDDLPADDQTAVVLLGAWVRRCLPTIGTDAMTLTAALRRRAETEGSRARLLSFLGEAMRRSVAAKKNAVGLFLTILDGGIKRRVRR